MCGIAGVIAWHDRCRIERETLEAMSRRIAHRGPDSHGLRLNHQRPPAPSQPQIALAHRRLAIIDLDRRADQPFTDGAGRWIVFNGEIYNYRELRSELSALLPDYRWRTASDTEVLLAAYAYWGRECLSRLDGMFAFAVWDESRQTLLLARDRMGQKPLYLAVCHEGGQGPGDSGAVLGVAFASELAALRPVPWVDFSIDPDALDEYLMFGYIAAPRTIHPHVGKLAAGQWMQISAARREAGQYFDPAARLEDDGCAEERALPLAQRTRLLVQRAVRGQLVADVPLGCFLSGGTDSSVIAAAMKAAVPPDQPVLTFSIGFADPRYDETAYAAAVAAHLGTRHHQFTVEPRAAEDLPALAEVYGEPFGDSSALPTHYLARETRRHVTVALSGDGGDELFGGYDRYRAMALADRIDNWPAPLRAAARCRAWQWLPGTHPKSPLARLKRFGASLTLAAPLRYERYLRLFSPEELSRLYGPMRPAPPLNGQVAGRPFDGARDVVAAAAALDRATYLPEDLHTKVDRASMLHALEVRSPFMDPRLLRLTSRFTAADLLGGGAKRRLREAFASDLPAFVFRRRKMGFAVPVGEWFRGELRGMLQDLLFAADSFAADHFDGPGLRRLLDDHVRGAADHSQRLYALLMLELWWRGARKRN